MILLALFICFTFYIYLKRKTRNVVPLPPGPPGDPIIGHIRLIPPENQETLFYKWGKIYGDVIHLRLLGQPVIVLNSIQAAMDLLDKRGAIYSDRPPFLTFKLMGWKSVVTLMRYGTRFQRHRRMLQQCFSMKQCIEYRTIQLGESRTLLQNLLANSDNRDDSVRRFATAIIIRVTFGHQITTDNDPYVKIADGIGYALGNAGSPGASAVDYFPFLQYFPSWFPGAYYAGFARDNKPVVDTLYDYPLREVSRQMVEGKAKPSFLATQLEAHNRGGSDFPNTLEDIKGAASAVYGAGVDTIWSTLSMFFLAMVLYPEHQARAQKEIDSVIGSDRLPEFEDRPSLPYVECLLKETLRWNSAAPLGVPHRSLEDDIYKGMFIPKGSLVIANTRGITLDENVYSDAAAFNPARFLPKPSGHGEPFPEGAFGFGRRICPGRHLADASLWIVMVSVLATLDISKVVDDKGREITPEVVFTSGITSHPYPFRCSIQPRSDASRVLIVQGDTSDTY
ncbi:cytochrome P450 [Collybia nuda]|uniref:Cytochrome P450 n=1 Tax=Collybia nuda TaxID=64659 RepID=A0A9P5XVX5_9AGAR|nr:cytochrome P450 [Collybia nuda]